MTDHDLADQLLAELVNAGVRGPGGRALRSVSGVDVRQYPQAIPILSRWLPLALDPKMKSQIAYALGQAKQNSSIARVLLDEYRRAPAQEASLTTALAAAVSGVAGDEFFEEIVQILADRTAPERGSFVAALGNMKEHRAPAVAVLMALLDEPDKLLVIGAIDMLGRLNATEAIERIHDFAEHEDTDYHYIAKRALKSITRGTTARASGSAVMAQPRPTGTAAEGAMEQSSVMHSDECSASMDEDIFVELMENVAQQLGGDFENGVTRQLMEEIAEAPIDERGTASLHTELGGAAQALRFEWKKEDFDTVDFWVFGPAEVIRVLDEVYDALMQKYEL